MRPVLILILILTLILVSVPSAWTAQRGTAESGCYPLAFYGTTFTGVLTSANDETREIKLTYSDPETGKTDEFVVVLEEGYTIKTKDGQLVELAPSQIKPGVTLKVYFLTQEKKIDGKKLKRQVVFDIQGVSNHRKQFKIFKPFRLDTIVAEPAPAGCGS